jgi:hypothetical protein
MSQERMPPDYPEQNIKVLEKLRLSKMIFLQVEKTIKSMNLYLSKGPFVRKNIYELVELFNQYLKDFKMMGLVLTPFEFIHENQAVYIAKKDSPGFSYKLFSDGAREILFSEGIEQKEILQFMDILRTDYSQQKFRGEDTVTRLWESNFQHLDYSAIDVFAETGIFDRNPARQKFLEKEIHSILARLASPFKTGDRSKTLRLGFSQEELKIIEESESEIDQDLRNIAHLQIEISELPRKECQFLSDEFTHTHEDIMLKFLEIIFTLMSQEEKSLDLEFAVSILEGMIDDFIMNGNWDGLARFAANIMTLERVDDKIKARWLDFVKLLLKRLSSGENIALIVEELPAMTPDEYQKTLSFFDVLRDDVLPHLVSMFMKMEEGKTKKDFLSYLMMRDADLTDYHIERTRTGSTGEAVSAIRYLAAKINKKSEDALKWVFNSKETTLRKEALLALANFSKETYREIASRALEDEYIKIRMTAMEILLNFRDQASLFKIIQMCRHENFLSITKGEKYKILSKLIDMKTDETWNLCSDLLKQFSFLKNLKLLETQEAILDALVDSNDTRSEDIIRNRIKKKKLILDRIIPQCRESLARIEERKGKTQ